jgi:ribose transport system permease protein
MTTGDESATAVAPALTESSLNMTTEDTAAGSGNTPEGGTDPTPGSMPRRLALVGLRYGMVWALIALIIAAQLLDSTFLSIGDIRDVISQNAAVSIIAVGMTFVIIGGGFDLSVGGTYGICAVVFAKLSTHMSLSVDVIVVMIVGALAGTVNGIIIARVKINPFVATLATSSLFLGAAYVYSASLPVNVAANHGALGTDNAAGIPVSGIVTAVVFIIGGILLSRTVFGQNVRAIGSNEEAARLSGLRIEVIRAATYVLTGALAGMAGAIDTSRLLVGQADQGANLPLLAITIVILGGTSLKGGEGAMWRTLVGALIIAVLTNLLNALAISTSVQDVVQGGVLLAAVSFDILVRRLRAASGEAV